jgi:hypothetical protein
MSTTRDLDGENRLDGDLRWDEIYDGGFAP